MVISDYKKQRKNTEETFRINRLTRISDGRKAAVTGASPMGSSDGSIVLGKKFNMLPDLAPIRLRPFGQSNGKSKNSEKGVRWQSSTSSRVEESGRQSQDSQGQLNQSRSRAYHNSSLHKRKNAQYVEQVANNTDDENSQKNIQLQLCIVSSENSN